MRHQLGQLMFIGLSGHSLTADEKKFIIENNIGGICLFGRNVSEPKQVHALCSEIQSLRHEMPNKTPLFIGIDMEGGRVARLKPPFNVWPPLKKVGDVDNPSLTFELTKCIGDELRAFGINLDFAPCLDVYTNPKNTVIGDRAISDKVEIVEKHASALVRGFIKSNVVACAKHFPGHGNTVIDSHLELPIEEANLERLESVELLPFKKAIKSRVDMIMTAHILFKNIDPDWPVTLSEKFLKNILRDELRYRGIIITDDLGMKAMAKYHKPEDIPVRALQAGCDMLLYCNEPDIPPIAIESLIEAVAQGRLSKEQIQESYDKVLELKSIRLIDCDPLPIDEALQVIQNHRSPI